jgi:hypothetical protein
MIISSNGPQNVDQIKVQFEHGNIFLSPEEYQRENAWDLYQKQLLIDSLFRGLDVPKFYLWRITQRTLSTGYPDGPTKDTPRAKGRTYAQLNADQQIAFGQSRLTIMVLEDATIDEIRDMLLRLQNGTPLNAQQKRDAMDSSIGVAARELVKLPFFTTSVRFANENAEQHLVASQMIHLELRDKILSCTSTQLDKLFRDYRHTNLDPSVVREIRRVLNMLGRMFPSKNPRLSRTYALGLY